MYRKNTHCESTGRSIKILFFMISSPFLAVFMLILLYYLPDHYGSKFRDKLLLCIWLLSIIYYHEETFWVLQHILLIPWPIIQQFLVSTVTSSKSQRWKHSHFYDFFATGPLQVFYSRSRIPENQASYERFSRNVTFSGKFGSIF